MKKHLFLIGAIALGLAACTNEALTPEDIENEAPKQEESTNLKTAKLRLVESSQDRVTIEPESRAYPNPGSLELYATIDNLSREKGIINGFVKEENGRYLSATCVYYHDGTYYVTYHMQGNNYNTTQEDETSGFIETFTLNEERKPVLGKIIMASNPSQLDFDFNHLYFDDLSNTNNSGNYTGTDSGVRFIVAGHTTTPTSSGKKQHQSMIGILNLNDGEGTIDYNQVLTGEKILDENGKSLGNEDSGDVNCVIRKYNYYYVATRKGLAVLNAKNDNLFTPIPNYVYEPYAPVENSIYFVRTPGSAKHLCHYYPAYGSGFSFLYQTKEFPEGYDGNTKLPASIVNFSMNAGDGTLCGMNSTDSKTTGPAIFNTADFDLTEWSLTVNQYPLNDNMIYPIDGKNVLANLNGRLYACLGKGGLYIRKGVSTMEGPSVVENTIKFTDAKDGAGSRPVNGIFVEDLENYNDGFIYVANGSCLTILDRETLEKVAEYSLYKAGEIEDASANYVHVVRTNESTNGKCPDRLITVAYGQQGVRILKFVPPTR